MVRVLPLEAKVDFATAAIPKEVHHALVEQKQFLMLLSQPDALLKSFDQFFDLKQLNVNASLRPYQKEGVAWLLFLQKFHLHGILCDDMGLGKTIQTLCCLATVYCGTKGNFLFMEYLRMYLVLFFL